MPFGQENKPLSFNVLIEKISSQFSDLPDSRKKGTANNLKYSMRNAVLSAFSVFFTQSPSFLDYQERMQKKHGKNNATSLFGVHKISDYKFKTMM